MITFQLSDTRLCELESKL